MSRRTVERAITGLEQLGLLKRRRRADQTGAKTSNAYALLIDASESRMVASESRIPPVTVTHTHASESRINQELLNQEVNLGRKRASSKFCPPDFEPNPALLRTARYPHGVSVPDELYRFKNHEFQRLISDWDRAFLNWLARAKPENKTNGQNKLEQWTSETFAMLGEGSSGDGRTETPVAAYPGGPDGPHRGLVERD